MDSGTERDFKGTGPTLEEAFQDCAARASEFFRGEIEREGLDPDDPENYLGRKIKNTSIELEVTHHNQWVRVYEVVCKGGA